MKISRTDLLKVLNLAKPALAAKDVLYEATCFWFTGKSVIAYDDKIGIEAPLETDFKGGLLGKLLLGVLEKSSAKEIEITEGKKESEMQLRAGNARVQLALLDPDRRIWGFPDFPDKNAFKIEKAFLDVLGEMLICVGQNTSMPDQLGITFDPFYAKAGDEDWLDLYSTDDAALAWARIDMPKGYEATRCVIPEEFCRQLISLTKKSGKMFVADDCVLAVLDDDVRLYGRLVDVPRPIDFNLQIEDLVPDPDKLVKMPNRFKMAMERVSVLIDHMPGAPCEVSIDDEGVMRLYAKADRGEIRDSLRLDGEHEEVTAWFDPALIKRASDKRTEIYVSRDALIMRGPENYYHLINAHGR